MVVDLLIESVSERTDLCGVSPSKSVLLMDNRLARLTRTKRVHDTNVYIKVSIYVRGPW